MIRVYFVAVTSELALYLIIHCGFVDDRNIVHDSDRDCEGGDLASGLDG